MPTIIRDGANTPRTITALQARDGTNTPRALTELWARDSNNVRRLIWSLAPPMSATASPGTVGGLTVGTGTATSNPATATPVGGTAPYFYAWQLISYDSLIPPTAVTPTNATTTFRQTGIAPTQEYSAVFQCQVTDSTPGTPLVVLTNTVAAFWRDAT